MSLHIPLNFLLAIAAIESGGDDLAFGRNAEIGCLQVGPCVLVDVNRFTGKSYTREQMFDRELALEVARAYLAMWCTEERLNRAPALHDAARIWHGGPNGTKKPHTAAYADRVMNIYNLLEE
jgi:soluble lytic murein transglycosylase-like protein